ncbi:MAG: hypothetical protein WBQ25_17190 [Nitrososphaeraceae archaeon]
MLIADLLYTETTQHQGHLKRKLDLLLFHLQIPAKEVAKVILNADILDNRNQRYIVGKYGEMMTEAKMTMSDVQYHNMMKKQLFGSK